MNILEGIRPDRTVEPDHEYGVETYYCPLEYIGSVADEFLRVGGDNGGTNVEIRVPFSVLVEAGWTAPAARRKPQPIEGH